MPKERTLNVEFPLGGLNRRGGYAQKTRPFTCFSSRNMRSVGPLEERGRGGTRPGLAKLLDHDFGDNITGMQKVSYVDSAGDLQEDLIVIADGSVNIVRGVSVTTTTAFLQTEDGDFIITEDGDFIIFESAVPVVNPIGTSNAFQMVEHEGKLHIADATPRIYDPITGTVQDNATAPTNQPLICFYQERLVLAGENHMFYMARQGDYTDFNFGDDKDDSGMAHAGFVGDNGIIGAVIKCMIPWRDQALILGTDRDLWVIYGNPTNVGGGRKENISYEFGIIAPKAAVVTNSGLLVFLSKDGLYTWGVGSNSRPEPFSPLVIPEELQNVDTSANEIRMEYDQNNRGINLYITPDSGTGTHWWIDLEYRALWPEEYHEDHQAVATTKLPQGGYSDVLIGCKDGYIRQYDPDADNDDGEDLNSDLYLGPFHLGSAYGMDGMIHSMYSDLADNASGVTWRTIVGDTAEDAADNADAAYAASWAAGISKSGIWGQGHNRRVIPRSRGAWGVLVMSSVSKWAYESVTMKIYQHGKLRV